VTKLQELRDLLASVPQCEQSYGSFGPSSITFGIGSLLAELTARFCSHSTADGFPFR
jgi:hypothetical protein